MTIRQFLLTAARERIEAGTSKYICYALNHVAGQHPQHTAEALNIIAEITAALHYDGVEYTLPMWVIKHLQGHHRGEVPAALYDDWMRNGPLCTMMRLAWIDKLIDNLENS